METLQWSFIFPHPPALPIVYSNTIGLAANAGRGTLSLTLHPAKCAEHHTLAHVPLIRIPLTRHSFRATPKVHDRAEGEAAEGEAAEGEAAEGEAAAAQAEPDEEEGESEGEGEEASDYDAEQAILSRAAGEAAAADAERADNGEAEEGESESEAEEGESESEAEEGESEAEAEAEEGESESEDDDDEDVTFSGIHSLDNGFDYWLDLGMMYGRFDLDTRYMYSPGLWFPLGLDEESPPELWPSPYRLHALFTPPAPDSKMILCGFEIWKVVETRRPANSSRKVVPVPMPPWLRCLSNSLRFVCITLMGRNVLTSTSTARRQTSRFPKHRLMMSKNLVDFPLQFGPEEQTSLLPQSLTGTRFSYRASLYAQPVVFVSESEALEKERMWLSRFGPGSVLQSGWLDEILSPAHLEPLIPWCTRPLYAAIRTRHTERGGDMLVLLAAYLEGKAPQLAVLARKTLNVTTSTPLLLRLPLHQLRNDPLCRLMLSAMRNRLFHSIVIYPCAAGDAIKDVRFQQPVPHAAGCLPPALDTSLAQLMGCPLTISDLVLSVSLVESAWVSPYKDPVRVLDENLTHLFSLRECISGEDLVVRELSSPSPCPRPPPLLPLHDISITTFSRAAFVEGLPARVGVALFLCQELATRSSAVKKTYEEALPYLLLTNTESYFSTKRKKARTKLARLEHRILARETSLQAQLDAGTLSPTRTEQMVERLQVLASHRLRLLDESKQLDLAEKMWSRRQEAGAEEAGAEEGDESLVCDSCHVDSDEFLGCSSSCGHRLCTHCFVTCLSRSSCPRCNVRMEKLLISKSFFGMANVPSPRGIAHLPSFEEVLQAGNSRGVMDGLGGTVVVRNMLGRGRARVEPGDPTVIWISTRFNSMDTSTENTAWSMYHRAPKFLENLNVIETALLNISPPGRRHLVFLNTAPRDTLMLLTMLRPSLSSTRITFHLLDGSAVQEEVSRMMELGMTIPYAGRYDSERANEANNAFYNERHHVPRGILLFSRVQLAEMLE